MILFWTLLLLMPLGALAQSLELEIAADRDPVQPGERLYLTVTVSNSGAGTLSDVAVSGIFPGFVDRVYYTETSPSLTGCSGNYCDPGDAFSWPVGTLSAGQSHTLRLPLVVSGSAVDGDEITLQVNAGHASDATAAGATQTVTVRQFATTNPLNVRITAKHNPLSPGGQQTYTLTYANRSQNTVAGVTLTALLPEGTTLDAADDNGVTGAGSVTWNLGNLPPQSGGQRRFTVSDTQGQAGRILQAEAQLRDNSGADSDISSTVLNVVRMPTPLDMEIALDSDPVLPGETYFYTVTVSNTSAGDTLENVSVSGHLPSHVDRLYYTEASSPLSDCSGNYCDPGEIISWSVGTLAPGKSHTLRLPVTVTSGTDVGALLNPWLRAGYDGEPDATTKTVTSTVTSSLVDPELNVRIVAKTHPFEPGGTQTYIVTYGNGARSTALGATLTALLPEGTTLDSAGDNGMAGTGSVTWNLGDLPVGGSGQRRFTITDTRGQAGRVLLAEAQLRDSGDGDFHARGTTTSVSRAATPLEMEVAINTDPVLPGEPYFYTVMVSNTSAGDALENVAVSGHLPTAVDRSYYTEASSPLSECSGNYCDPGEMFSWSVGTLAPGQTHTLRLPARVTDGTDAGTLLAPWLRAGYDGEPDATARTETSTVTSPLFDPGLNVRIDGAHNPMAPGEQQTYTVTYGNSGQSTAPGVTLTALLPEGTTLDSAGGDGMAGTGSVSWSLGDLPAGGSGQRRFTVTDTQGRDGRVLVAEAQLGDSSDSDFDTRGSTVGVTGTADQLDLAATVEADPVAPGERYYYIVTVSNNTAGTYLDNVSVSGSMPAAVQRTWHGYAIPSLSDCSSNYCDPGETFSWSVGTLLPGQSRTLRIPITTASDLAEGSLLDTWFRAGHDGDHDDIAKTLTSAVMAPGLDVRIATGQNPMAPGGQQTYTVTYANRSTGTAADVTLTALLPEGTTASTTGDDGVAGTDAVNWGLGNVPAGSGGRRQFTVTDTQGQTGRVLNAEAQIRRAANSSVFDARGGTTTSTRMDVPLSLAVVVDTDTALPGEPFKYTLTVTNTTGGTFLENVSVSSHFPDGVVDIGSSAAMPAISSGCCDYGRPYSWSLGELTPGQSTTLELPLTVGGDTEKGQLIHPTFLAYYYPAASIAQAAIAQRTVLVGDEHTDSTPIRSGPTDLDCNNDTSALTDGLLVIRYLFGFRGQALTSGALGAGANCDTAAIETYMADSEDTFDIDGNGSMGALTDGLLMIRYLFGFRGDSLITGAIGAGATRTTAAQIEAYLDTLL